LTPAGAKIRTNAKERIRIWDELQPMTKLEIQAIRALPEEYVRDGTGIHPVVRAGAPLVDRQTNYLVAMNPALPPILFKEGSWQPVTPHKE
jgi:hypothetical protein